MALTSENMGRCVAVSADGRTAVSGDDGTVRVWDLTDDSEQARWTADGAETAVAFNTAVIVVGEKAGRCKRSKN